jgi:hypothetical protein
MRLSSGASRRSCGTNAGRTFAEQIVADTIRFRGSLGRTLTGRDEFKRYLEMVLNAFPDWDNKIDDILATVGACLRENVLKRRGMTPANSSSNTSSH